MFFRQKCWRLKSHCSIPWTPRRFGPCKLWPYCGERLGIAELPIFKTSLDVPETRDGAAIARQDPPICFKPQARRPNRWCSWVICALAASANPGKPLGWTP